MKLMTLDQSKVMLPKSENACREDSETSIDFVVLSKPCWETTVTSDSTKV